MLRRPTAADYNEFYDTYVSKVPSGDVMTVLEESLAETIDLLQGVPEELETHAYAPGKWTIREVLGHMVDTERLFGFRALWMARGDEQDQPGMDQDLWNRASSARDRPLADLLEELSLVRRGHLLLFRSFSEDEWNRTGRASGFPFTVLAFPYILAGHEIHHRRVLADRYLAAH